MRPVAVAMPEINFDFFIPPHRKQEGKKKKEIVIATQKRLLGARSEILMRRSSRPPDDECQQPKQRKGRQVTFFSRWPTRIDWINLETKKTRNISSTIRETSNQSCD